MKSIKFLVTSVIIGLLLTGCATVNIPDYNSFNQTKKSVDFKKGYVGEGKYTFVSSTSTNLALDLAGYNKTTSNTVEGDLTITKNGEEVMYVQNIKLPFFTSDTVRLKYYSDKCGNAKNIPYLEVLNKDGTEDSSSYKVRNHKKIKEMLQNIYERKNLYACSNWYIGQIKDEVNYFDTLITFTLLGDKLTFVPLSIPIKYNGIVTHNKKEYYYFTVDNGEARIDSKTFNDDIAKFKVTAKILVNMNNYIPEYVSVNLKGNMWIETYNFDVEIKSNYEFKTKI